MITPNQIREKKISTVESDGYDRNEVNELLVEIIDSYEAVCAENKELYRKMEILANKIEEYREDEDSIKTAIISAQKTAHQITSEAKEKAEKTVSESNASAQQTVQDAKEKADKIIGEARDYVANLTQEKTKIADEIIAEAQEKANNAISSAKLVARDSLDKAKRLSEEIISKAKTEKEHNEEIVSRLRAESKEFKSTLVSLYETQLTKLRDLTSNLGEPESEEDLEKELNTIISDIDSVSVNDLTEQEPEIDTAPQDITDDTQAEEVESEAEKIEEEEIISIEDEIEEDSEIDEIEEIEDDSEAEVDEIISELEDFEPAFAVDEEEEEEENTPPTQEEVADAINAFTDNELTPVEGTGATIPVIEEEPEFDAMPFESFFNVDKAAGNTDETISLTAPDEDDDDDSSKFKGFFKKRK